MPLYISLQPCQHRQRRPLRDLKERWEDGAHLRCNTVLRTREAHKLRNRRLLRGAVGGGHCNQPPSFKGEVVERFARPNEGLELVVVLDGIPAG